MTTWVRASLCRGPGGTFTCGPTTPFLRFLSFLYRTVLLSPPFDLGVGRTADLPSFFWFSSRGVFLFPLPFIHSLRWSRSYSEMVKGSLASPFPSSLRFRD